MPTSRGAVKKLAAYEKNVADPPSTFSCRPCGVSTESNAMVPGTNSDINDLTLLRESPARPAAARDRRKGGHYKGAGFRGQAIGFRLSAIGKMQNECRVPIAEG